MKAAVAYRLNKDDHERWNEWSKKAARKNRAIEIRFDDSRLLPPVKTEEVLWQDVTDSRNKLEIVCDPGELELVATVIQSLDFPEGATSIVNAAGQGLEPADNLEPFLVQYATARLGLVNAYRKDVLELPTLPAPSPTPSPTRSRRWS